MRRLLSQYEAKAKYLKCTISSETFSINTWPVFLLNRGVWSLCSLSTYWFRTMQLSFPSVNSETNTSDGHQTTIRAIKAKHVVVSYASGVYCKSGLILDQFKCLKAVSFPCNTHTKQGLVLANLEKKNCHIMPKQVFIYVYFCMCVFVCLSDYVSCS